VVADEPGATCVGPVELHPDMTMTAAATDAAKICCFMLDLF
jgi:hypothetical protein